MNLHQMAAIAAKARLGAIGAALMGAGLVAALAAPALAGDVKAETAKLDGFKIAVYPFEFLNETELTTLRLVMTNADALKIFLPTNKGFAAMAVAPADGFIKGAAPAKSAVARADFADLDAARTAVLADCNAAKSGGDDCVVVLEVSP